MSPERRKCSKLHVLSDAAGLPLVVAVSAANVYDSQALKPAADGIAGAPN
ncbi:transposase [Actinomadura nitritigenes]